MAQPPSGVLSHEVNIRSANSLATFWIFFLDHKGLYREPHAFKYTNLRYGAQGRRDREISAPDDRLDVLDGTSAFTSEVLFWIFETDPQSSFDVCEIATHTLTKCFFGWFRLLFERSKFQLQDSPPFSAHFFHQNHKSKFQFQDSPTLHGGESWN